MKIESNRVIISSEKEFDDVSKICLANGRTWNDSDTTYNAIDGNNNAIIMLISSEKILYVRNVGFGEYKELSYSDFMNKYGDKQKRSNKMDSDIVRITSKEQLKRVEEICFDNKVYWEFSGKNHKDYYKGINLYIKIGHDSTEKDDKFAITQSSTLYDEETSMEYDEFINKHDKSNGDKMKIKPCRIKVTSKEEFKKVEEVCFENDIGWGSGGRIHQPFFNGIDLIIIIDEVPFHNNRRRLSFSPIINGPYLSFDVFMRNFKSSNYRRNFKSSNYRIKTEEEFINEFGDNWRSKTEAYFTHSMDYLLGKELNEEQINEYKKNGNFYIDGWGISKGMIIKNHTQTLMNKIKTVLHIKQKEPTKLNNSLYKTSNIKLNQDNKL